MRILKLRLQNINSLKGSWLIDFEDPAYADGGLFAICGPTGAGKSSLLDAICVALYGCTPRLADITAGANEAMTRGAGIMESEVTFSARGVRYRALFSQRRARERADGKLQGVTIELSRFDPQTGKWQIIEGKHRKRFNEQIEAITGLTFKQFTRSALLAQGNFSVFLKAKDEERAQALEAITGTEIYSQISQAVFNRHKAEKEALDKLKLQAQAVGVMPADERARTQQELQQALGQVREVQSQIKAKEALREAVQLRDQTVRRLKEDKLALEASLQTYAQLAPQRLAAAAARKALKLEPLRRELERAQSRSREACERRTLLQNQEAAARQALEQAKTDAEKAGDRSTALAAEFTKLLELLKVVRPLDATLQQETAQLADKEKSRREEEKRLAESLDKKQRDARELEKLEAEATQLQTLTADDSLAARLFARQTEIFSALSQYSQTFDDSTRRSKEVREARRALDLAEEKFNEAVLAQEPARQKITGEEENLAQLQAERIAAAGGRTLNALADEHRALVEKTQLLKELLRKIELKDDKLQQIVGKTKELEKTRKALDAKTPLLQTQQSRISALQTSIESLQQLEEMRSLVEKFNDSRAALIDGEPCPLCGAVHHPYAQGKPAALSDCTEKLKNARKELREAQKAEVALARALAQIEGSAKAIHEARAALEGEVQFLVQSIRNDADDLLVARPEQKEVQARIKAATQEAGAIADRIAALTQLDDKRNAAQEALQKAKDALEAQARTVRKLEQARGRAQQALQGAEHEEKTAVSRLQTVRTDLENACAGLIEPPQDAAKAAECKAELQRLLAEHQKRCERLSEVRRRQTALQAAVTEQAGLQEQLQQRIAGLCRQEEQARSELAASQQRRRELFADKSPDQEEEALKKACGLASAALEAAQRKSQELQARSSALAGELEAAGRQQQTEAAALEAAQKQWNAQRSLAGFEADALWQSALLPEDEVQRREQRDASLLEEQKKLAQDIAAMQKDLEELCDKARPEVQLETVLAEIEGLDARLAALNEEKGRLDAKIERDDEERARLVGQLATVAGQEKKLALWSQLNDLIGSANGQKYRTFVQSMTFETLLFHANRALARISQRYILKKDAVSPLKLNVIDTYQGGVERSADNLSGGESFLVSLALALGLSEMASRSVRVESLFLDEGFGSLDPDTLEDAMNALAALQSEGKMIGIISHVGEVRERISTRIDVTPVSGGRSTLSGPGVTSLDKEKEADRGSGN